MTKGAATPIQKLKVAKRTRARRQQEQDREDRRRTRGSKAPPSASLFTSDNEAGQQELSSPPKKKLRSAKETEDPSQPDASTQVVESTPNATNVSKPVASLPVRTLPLAQPNEVGQFRSKDDCTDEEDHTRGDETQEDTDVENDGDDDIVVNQQLPSSIKVQLTLETAAGLTSPELRRSTRSNLKDPLSTTLAAASSTPRQERMFRPIRSQSESLTPVKASPPSFLHPEVVKQPPQPPNPLDIYNQFVTTGGDDSTTGPEDDLNSPGSVNHPTFAASAASSFAPIHPTTTRAQNLPYQDETDEDAQAEQDPSHLSWRLGNRYLIDWQGREEIWMGLFGWLCLASIVLFTVGSTAKSFWDVHRFQYHQLVEEYQLLVDILMETKMEPIPHQFCINKDDPAANKSWWLPQKPTVLREVLHSEQSRQSILQMQEQIVTLEAELKWWKNDANAKEAELVGFKDQHEQGWNNIMNECSKAMTNASNNQNQDTEEASWRLAAYAALDEDLQRIHGGPTTLELLREMRELNRILERSNEELIEYNLEWEQGFKELHEAYEQLQEQSLKERRQREAEEQRFDEEYQALLHQRNRMAHETRQLERESAEMKDLIQEDSRKRLSVWLGGGPTYEVEFKLHFQDDDDYTFHYMTVELDGLNMPHSVFTFLSQVELGAYQGQLRAPAFWFSHVGDHAVRGLPTNFDALDNWSLQWPSLVFQETQEQVSREAYALGWIGMGPELYLGSSMSRNTPFGRVTRGSEVVDRMYSGATLEPSENRLHQLNHPVSLVSVTIL